tara:strand:- start:5528 stop:5743 length:216 start_codon:yes stop_codon:yes gene_type:complete
MKLNELIKKFTIAMSNEEKDVLESIKGAIPISSFDEREQFVIENLIRKSLVSKVKQNGYTMVVANEFPKTS